MASRDDELVRQTAHELGVRLEGCSPAFQATAIYILFDTRMDFPEVAGRGGRAGLVCARTHMHAHALMACVLRGGGGRRAAGVGGWTWACACTSLLIVEGGWWCVYLVRGAGGVAAAIFLGPPLLCEQTGSGSAVQGLGLPCKVFHASTKCKCDVYCISMPTVSYGVTYNLKKWPTCMEGRWLWA